MLSPALESRYVEVDGYRIHYVEAGRGAPAVFIHGNPTSCYFWRNVLTPVAQSTRRRCLAFDLLGFGDSDRPDIPYSLELHARIVAGFIERLGLEDVILVGEDWGGPLAAGYAAQHPQNVRGLALTETFLWSLDWRADFRPCIRSLFRTMRSPLGFVFLQMFNMMTRKMLPRYSSVSPEALRHYIDSFPTVRSRRAMREFPKLLPINGSPAASEQFIALSVEACAQASWPMLWIKATPGLVPSDDYPSSLRGWEELRGRIPRMAVKEFGPGRHFLAEENPQRLAELLIEWLCEIEVSPTGTARDIAEALV